MRNLILTKAVVVALLKSSAAAAVVIAAFFFYAPAVWADPVADLTKKIFGTPKAAECKLLHRGPGVSLTHIDPKIHEFLNSFVQDLREKKVSNFKRYFHPRARAKSDFGDRVLASLRVKYKEPWQFSVYRVWGLYAPDGDKASIPCHEDGIILNSRYSYPLQFAVWLQIMGQTELGRIFVAIAPKDNTWYVVGLHLQQWTQAGKDYEVWVKSAQAALAKKDMVHAHMYFDVAQKLLWGGEFSHYPIKDEIIAARDQALTKSSWLELAQKTLKEPSLVYIGTILPENGAGILLREKVETAPSTPELQKRCMAQGKRLIDAGWLSGAEGGLRCEYVFPSEDPLREGKLGGLYFSRSDILKKSS